MTAPASPMKMILGQQRTCVGFVLSRGPKGYEAFSANEMPLGEYPTEEAAVAAIIKFNESA